MGFDKETKERQALPLRERLQFACSQALGKTMLEIVDYDKCPPACNAFWFLLKNYHWRTTRKSTIASLPDQDTIRLSGFTAQPLVDPLKPLIARLAVGQSLPLAINCLADFSEAVTNYNRRVVLPWGEEERQLFIAQKEPVYQTWQLTPPWADQPKRKRFLRRPSENFQPYPDDQTKLMETVNPRIVRLEVNPQNQTVLVATNWATAEFDVKLREVVITSRLNYQLFGQYAETKQHQLPTLQGTMAGFLVDFFASFSGKLSDYFFPSQKN